MKKLKAMVKIVGEPQKIEEMLVNLIQMQKKRGEKVGKYVYVGELPRGKRTSATQKKMGEV